MTRKSKDGTAKAKKKLDYGDIDFTKLRYVLYARKSTTNEERQAHSIPDQIRFCQEMAKREGLNIVKVLEESQSAKTADKRPVFDQMLKDLKAQKYDGIIAWHPDRLCRNMLEAGKIIDMLDRWEIIDLKFCQHHFENNASGKMMLGMMFVFSKQYSDSLAERVQRGVSTNVDRGISGGTKKWGYTRVQATGHYEPDENFDIIKRGWEMRLEGETLQNILNFFKRSKLSRTTESTGHVDKLKSKSTVERIFRDTFYYGVLVQGDDEIHLCEHYDFKPMITEEDYNQAQAIGYKQVKKYNRIGAKAGRIFFPLRNMVVCDVCKHPMSPGRHMPKDKSGRVLYYTCRYKNCHRRQKGVMAGEIFDQIYRFLDSLELDEKAYKQYIAELDSMTENVIEDIKTAIKSKRGIISNNISEINKEGDKLGKTDSKTIIKACNKRIAELENENAIIEMECDGLEARIKDSGLLKLEQKDFVNLMKTLGNKMRVADAAQKDQIAKKLFVNLYLDDEKKLHFLLKEPFDSVFNVDQNLLGWG